MLNVCNLTGFLNTNVDVVYMYKCLLTKYKIITLVTQFYCSEQCSLGDRNILVQQFSKVYFLYWPKLQ